MPIGEIEISQYWCSAASARRRVPVLSSGCDVGLRFVCVCMHLCVAQAIQEAGRGSPLSEAVMVIVMRDHSSHRDLLISRPESVHYDYAQQKWNVFFLVYTD